MLFASGMAAATAVFQALAPGDHVVAPRVMYWALRHWLLDFVGHRPDMPLYPGGSERLGLSLWNSLPATFAVEGAMFALAIALYVRVTRARDRTGSIAWWALVALLLALYIPGPWSPPPQSENAVAVVGIAALLVFVPWAYRIDRRREVRG
jgi:hypothetical protein